MLHKFNSIFGAAGGGTVCSFSANKGSKLASSGRDVLWWPGLYYKVAPKAKVKCLTSAFRNSLVLRLKGLKLLDNFWRNGVQSSVI